MSDKVTVSRSEMVKAFEEWQRRYREQPEEFMAEVRILGLELAEYGELATGYLLHLLGKGVPVGP
jgi:hypothetical protein